METEKVVHFLPCKPVGPTEDCKQTKATVCVKYSVPVFISSTQTCIAHVSGARTICLVTFDSCTAMRYIKSYIYSIGILGVLKYVFYFQECIYLSGGV